MKTPHISYVDPAKVTDKAMLAEFERCAREGTPRPESQAIRAHVPAVFWSFANSWRDVFKNGVADHDIKELCRVYVSRSVKCEFCGNQRSMKAAIAGSGRGRLSRPDQLRILAALRRAPEGGAVLCRGDHLGSAGRRRLLGAAEKAFQRAGAGRDRLFRRADHGPAALAAHARYRAPPDHGRHRRVDGAGFRDRGSVGGLERARRLLGAQQRRAGGTRGRVAFRRGQSRAGWRGTARCLFR